MLSTMTGLHVDLGACQENTVEPLKLMALLTNGKYTPQLLCPACCVTPAKHEP